MIEASPAGERAAGTGWRAELTPRNLLASLNAGLILYLFEVILAVSFAALVFSEGDADLLPYALGSVLVGAALLVAVCVVLGSYGGSIPAVQDAPSVVLGLAAASVVATSSAGAQGQLPTVILLTAGTTLVFGIACLALGAFRLGALVRFLPYPVLGGFLAGTGWLLALGGLRVTTDVALGTALLDSGELVRWLPALGLGLLAFLAARRWTSPFVLPVLLAIALGTFYLTALATGHPATWLSADGWLLGPFPDDVGVALPLDPALLSRVSWPALVEAIPLAAPAILFGIIGLLLNSSSVELIVRRELQLDRELVVTGGANVASGLLGGLPGYAAISVTVVGHSLGHDRRVPGLIVAVLLLATLFAGMGLLSLIPRMLLGGLLVYIGVSLLSRWVIEARRSLSRPDYLVVLAILLVIALTDLLWGVVLGLGLAVVIFVIDYSRVSLIRYEMSGSDYRSRVRRGARDVEILDLHGHELLIVALQGYLFFGTAYQLVDRVRRHVGADAERDVRVVLLDLARVSGLDSTARNGFERLVTTLRAEGIELLLTGLPEGLVGRLVPEGALEGTRAFADLDQGVEWAEDLLLSLHRGDDESSSLDAELASLLPGESRIGEIVGRMRRQLVSAGDVIVRQGEESSALYLLESGRLTARLEREGREPVRLTTIRAGGFVGEIGFFLGSPRSATVVADLPSVLRVLTRAEWEALGAGEPELARLVERLTITALGQRLVESNRAIDALLR